MGGLHDWDNFLVGELGAAAALAGLLFVAVSINLSRILEFPSLPTRVVEALLSFLSVLVVATWGLIPGQSPFAFGIEIGVTGLITWLVLTVALISTARGNRPRFAARVLLNQLPPLPFVVAGALLLAGNPQALYWIVPGVLLSFAAGLFGAWVLLIEIQR